MTNRVKALGWALSVAVLCAPAALGQLCKPALLASFGGPARDVAIENDLACVAVGCGGLLVADVSDLSITKILGAMVTPNDAIGVVMAGAYAYVLDEHALHAVDISDPSKPFIVDSASSSDPYRIILKDNFIYVADGDAGIKRFDISDPSRLEFRGALNTNGIAMDVDVAENGAIYISDFNKGLKIAYPVSPDSLALVTTFQYPFSVRAVSLMDDFIVVASYSSIRVLDKNYQEIGVAPTLRLLHDVLVTGDFAHSVNYNGNIQTFDIRNPAAPQLVELSGSGEGAPLKELGELVVTGGGTKGVAVFSGGAEGDLNSAGGIATAFGGNVQFDKDLAYVGGAGLSTFQLNGESPVELLGMYSGTTIGDLVISGGYVYTIGLGDNSTLQLESFDVSNPAAPAKVGALLLGAPYRGISISDSTVYLCGGQYNHDPTPLLMIDVSDPANPMPIAAVDVDANAVSIADGLLYAAGDFVLTVLDLSDPFNVEIVGEVELAARATAIDIANGFAYVSSFCNCADGPHPSLEIIDISAPTNPVSIASLEVDSGLKIHVEDDIAYLAGGLVEFVDVSDQTNPSVAAMFYPSGGSVDVATFGDFMFVKTTWGFEKYSLAPCLHPGCTSDFNDDGVTDGTDLSMLLQSWYLGGGLLAEPIAPNGGPNNLSGYAGPQIDLTDDNLVNGADLAVLLANWGPCR